MVYLLITAQLVACDREGHTPAPQYPDYTYHLDIPNWLTVSGSSPRRVNARWAVPASAGCEAADRFQVDLEEQGQNLGDVAVLTSASADLHPNEWAIVLVDGEVMFRGGYVESTRSPSEATLQLHPEEVCTLDGECDPYDATITFEMTGPAMDWEGAVQASEGFTDRSTGAPLCDIVR